MLVARAPPSLGAARRLADEHCERSERDQLELHHASHAQRQLLRDLGASAPAGRVHNEDDPVAKGGRRVNVKSMQLVFEIGAEARDAGSAAPNGTAA